MVAKKDSQTGIQVSSHNTMHHEAVAPYLMELKLVTMHGNVPEQFHPLAPALIVQDMLQLPRGAWCCSFNPEVLSGCQHTLFRTSLQGFEWQGSNWRLELEEADCCSSSKQAAQHKMIKLLLQQWQTGTILHKMLKLEEVLLQQGQAGQHGVPLLA